MPSLSQIVSGKSFTAVAVSTAAKAGEWLKTRLGQPTSVQTKSSERDLVTEVDRGTETMIRNLIRTHFPGHAFLGEEGTGAGEPGAVTVEEAAEAEYVWIIDPIDGTTNFIHGFPFFSISLALAYRGEVIVGVIYDPSRDELFVAEKNKGAYVRGRRMSVSRESALGESLLATGFPSRPTDLERSVAAVAHLAPRVRNIRTAGSAALHLAYVAAGRLSGFFEPGLNAWDVAAGVLLVRESGGTVTDMDGRPFRLGTRNIVATNGRVHGELLAALRTAGCAG
ncbi:MAG: inositol monophosphatase [Candidatus Reconcilbacillus cellulovorans]|uniref:Inositol-1-monophosphatase n=1 Tax=Candidatus Reconcilbacillus cellulovorans TaxID=1906605 RepID=A0A2A6DZ08_9BACL|nr:MAG: inositol monophosphatase [Candidatus Reconcilbacillus cellulovorans]